MSDNTAARRNRREDPAALPEIKCPTLIVHRRPMRWLDISLRRDVRARGARLAVLEGPARLPAAILSAVDRQRPIASESGIEFSFPRGYRRERSHNRVATASWQC